MTLTFAHKNSYSVNYVGGHPNHSLHAHRGIELRGDSLLMLEELGLGSDANHTHPRDAAHP